MVRDSKSKAKPRAATKRPAVKKPAKKAVNAKPTLERTTFTTSREMDFFSEKGLVAELHHPPHEWPLVFLKEGIDNALDACEEVDVAPKITVSIEANGMTVSDNGGGIPETTIDAAIDFKVRASSREAYVAPDRGAQGNALMTLVAIPHIVDPEHGRLIIRTHGVDNVISCAADPTRVA